MPKSRSPDEAKKLWKKIRKEWEELGTPPKELAEKYDVKLGTLKSRKSREKWGEDEGKMQLKRVATPKQKVATVATSEADPEIEEIKDKQELFCLLYVKYFNATKAYQKVYGCSYASAMTNGSRMLRNAKIRARIEELKTELFNDVYLDARAVLQKWVDIAFSDIGDFIEFGRKTVEKSDGIEIEVNSVRLRDSADLDTSLLIEVKEGREGVSIKLVDKIKALEVLTKYYDVLSDAERTKLQLEKMKVDIEVAQGKVW